MRRRRIEVEIDRLVVDDPASARTDFAAALQRELGRLAREETAPQVVAHERMAPSPVSAVARQIHARLGR